MRIARNRKVSSISRFTASTDWMSRFIERRGVSISTQFSPAFTVAERRRPDRSPISPKNCPRFNVSLRVVTPALFAVATDSMFTSPSRIEKNVLV